MMLNLNAVMGVVADVPAVVVRTLVFSLTKCMLTPASRQICTVMSPIVSLAEYVYD